MDDRLASPRRGRCPIGFLGAIAMILAVEMAIAHQKMGSFGGSQWAYDLARSEADLGDQGCEVLFFGDSLLKQGLAPTVIEAKGGLRAYNFALAGGQAPGHYFLLRRALESGARPASIVVENLPRLMATDPDFNLENWPFLATPAECIEMARLMRSPSLLADLTLREIFPSVRCRNSIRHNIQTALAGNFPMFAREILTVRRNWEVNRGAEIVASRPGRVEDVEEWMRGYFPDFRCSKVNRVYIDKFLDLAAQHEIPVFWLLPPYKPELQARCEQAGIDALHEAFLRGYQARYSGLHVIDGRKAGYDPGVFTDLHHLGREGAAIFSAEVAGLLRRHHDDPASTPRWLKLAGNRAIAPPAPLEDMDESRRKVVDIAAKGSNSLAR